MKTIRLTFAALALSAPGLMAFPFATPALIRSDVGRVVAVEDFNRDGRAEILMASLHSLVWLRHSTGTVFTQAATLSWGPEVGEVVTRDMDGDGDMDVVLNLWLPSQLVILRNDGNFVFTKVLETAVGQYSLVAGAIAGDYDHDGDMDAGHFHTVAGETVRRITWADNNGGGTFTLNPVTQNAASLDWQQALTADFNGDGYMDLAMAYTNGEVIRGTRSGVFLPWPTIPFTGLITHMEAGDIDGDSRPDLVLTSGGSTNNPQRAAWCRSNGSGFDAPVSIQNHTTGRVRSTHLVDMDEDGDLDAVFGDQAFYVDNANQGSVQIMWAENSDGDFLLPKVLHSAYEAADIRSGDVDGDGDSDLVFSANDDVQFVQNTAIHRTAEFGSTRGFGTSSAMGDICAADLLNTGEGGVLYSIPAVNIVNFTGGHTSSAVPGLGVTHTISSNSPGAGAVAAGDLNHDGLTDVVIACSNGALQIASRNGANWVVSVTATLPAGTTELEVADVDRDGNNDIIIGHATGIRLLRGNGGSTPTWTEENVVNNIGPVTKICPVQLTGGGRLEIMAMTVETSPARCRIYRFPWLAGLGIWQNPAPSWEGDSASSLLAIGDANRDQARDVFYAVTSTVNCAPSTITGAGFGTLKSVAGQLPDMRCAEAADFNNDGITDLAIAGGGQTVLVTGKSDGTFAAPVPIFSKPGAELSRMVVYDFEDDGDMDIMVLDETGDEVQTLYNNCGQFDLTELGLGEVIPATPSAAPMAMHLTFTHGGRTGDAAATIRSLRFRLLKTQVLNGQVEPAAGLTTAEATALLSALEVYNDAGEVMNFESGTDALLGTVGPATSTGYLTVTPAAISIAPGATVRLWVRVRMAANAGSSAIRSFFLQHITDPAAAGTAVTHSAGSTSNHRLDPMLIEEASVRILVPGALENWRFTNWGQYDGTGPAANDADPDGDNLPNLMEYVMDRNPNSPAGVGSNVPLEVIFLNRETPVQVDLRLVSTYDSRVRLTIQSSFNMQSWSTLSTRTGTGAWSIAPASTTLLSGGGRTRFVFNATVIPQNAFKQYFRVKAEELP